MRKSLAIIALLILCMTAVSGVFAGTTAFAVNLTAASPALQSCAPVASYYYQAVPITPTATGTHVFFSSNASGVTPFMEIYLAEDFDPTSECTARLDSGSTLISTTLTEGMDYLLVATTTISGATGTYDVTHIWPNPAEEEDRDGDGVPDDEDQCPDEPDVDVDNDGTVDCLDSLIDSDNDGVADSADQCPGHDDAVDVDGDGTPDGCDALVDSDNDGVADSADQCPGHDDTVDVDGDGTPDGCDLLIDSDDDGVADSADQCPGQNDTIDADGDSIPDCIDPLVDSDGDGVEDSTDQCPGHDDNVDVDGDGTPDGCDSLIDSDDDGVEDSSDQCDGQDDKVDVDNDSIPDCIDPTIDSDGDGVADSADQCPGFDDNLDLDANGTPDGCDDSDGDGVPDVDDQCPGSDDHIDVDHDSIPDGCDPNISAEKDDNERNGSDIDNDGVSNSRDNCPYDYNPGQEDGWGTTMGDLCDTEWYNMRGIGISGFEQKNGMYHLHGNCTFMADGNPRCPEVAIFNPAAFTPGDMPLDVTSEYANGWSVWVYYLHSNNGADVYQVNVYTSNPPQPDTLIDDRLEIHVRGGTWKWYQRGGDRKYNGN